MASFNNVFRYNFPVVSLALSHDGTHAAYCVDDTALTRVNPTKEEVIHRFSYFRSTRAEK